MKFYIQVLQIAKVCNKIIGPTLGKPNKIKTAKLKVLLETIQFGGIKNKNKKCKKKGSLQTRDNNLNNKQVINNFIVTLGICDFLNLFKH